MKFSDTFSDAAVLKRSQQATRELDVAARSAKVKKELDAAAAAKKRGTLKEFSDFRAELNEGVEEIAEQVPHYSMPPNILILRRKTIRQFPNNVMVALYYNDKLGQYFSIPYGGGVEGEKAVITPVSLKEEALNEVGPQEFFEDHEVGDDIRYRTGDESHLRTGKIHKVEPSHLVVKRGGYSYKVPHENVVHNERTGYRPEEMNEETMQLHHGPVGQLRSIRDAHQHGMVTHKDGTSSRVDTMTAHALLTVHDSLKPENQQKFAEALHHSPGKLKKLADFAFSQVK
jgi:hypothetical protein